MVGCSTLGVIRIDIFWYDFDYHKKKIKFSINCADEIVFLGETIKCFFPSKRFLAR